MISLLLTLFISLFSYCPAVYSVDHNENNIFEISESVPTKNMYRFNNSMYLASGAEFMDSNFFTKLIQLAAVNVGTQTPTSFEVQNVVLQFANPNNVSVSNGVISASSVVNVDKITLITASSGTLTSGLPYYRYQVKFTYGSTNYFSYYVDWITNLDADNYFVDLSPYVFTDIGDSGLRTYLLIFDRSSSNNETVFNLLYDINASASYLDGYDNGFTYGYDNGYIDGTRSGYQSGYVDGLNEGTSFDSTASTIFEGIFDVGLLPVNVFLTIFNFDLFGVNIAGIISGLLTLAVVVIIIRFMLGGKGDDK